MAEATLTELQATLTALKANFKKIQPIFFKAQKAHDAAKAELSAFETKYGRALALVAESSNDSDT